jgi:hypothetical protein
LILGAFRSSQTPKVLLDMRGWVPEASQAGPKEDGRLRNPMADIPRTCPHCESGLKKWRVPEDATWDEEFFFVCFNDECSYYKEGWAWMKEQYNQHTSNRYAVNPTTGASFPLPVWSASATREMIVDDGEGDEE